MSHKFCSLLTTISRIIMACCLLILIANILPLRSAQAFVGTWALIQPMNYARFGHTATLIPSGSDSGKVLVVGGSLNISIPSTGGVNGSPSPAAGDSSTPAGQTAEFYDPSNPTSPWLLTANLNVPRVFHCAAWIGNGKVLVAGGANSVTGNGLNSAEIYNPIGGPGGTPIWSLTPNMSNIHISATSTVLDDGRVLIAGGYSGTIMSGSAINSVEIFNPANGTWTSARHMNHSRVYHTATLIHPAGSSYGKVLVIGGSTDANSSARTPLASAEVYDPQSNTWTDVQSLSLARSDHSATLLENGQVLITGGYNPTQESSMYLANAEIYNPDNNTWTATGSLTYARGNHSATLLQNSPQHGKVLVVGGADSSNPILTAELFDPSSGTWLDAGDIMTETGSRVSHTATSLSNGKVLIAGGYLSFGTSGASADASAELYTPSIPQTITITQSAPPTANYQTTFTVAATASSGLEVTYSSGSPTICSNVGADFTMVSGTGSCVVQYDQSGNGNYSAAPQVTQSVLAKKVDQTITITQAAPDSAPYQSTFTVIGTADSNLNVVYSSGSPDICSAGSNGLFTMVKGTGTCVVQYDQPGNDNYNPAVRKTNNVAAEKISQTLTFTASGERAYGTDFSVSAKTTSKLLINFNSGSGDPCTVVSTSQDSVDHTITSAIIHPSGLGLCTLTAGQPGDDNYLPATNISQFVTIIKGDQVITVTNPAPSSAAYQTTFIVSATASSGLPVTVSSGSETVCSVAGNQFTMLVSSGICKVQYDQEGNSLYNPAAQISSDVTAVKASQIITFAALSNKTYNDPDFTVTATASSGLPVSFSVGASDQCTISGSTVHITAAGSCTVTAAQGGDGNYLAASPVSRSFNIAKASQTITFNPLPSKAYGDPDFTLVATTTSGLLISYGMDVGNQCVLIDADTIHITGVGTCTVTATQSGNDNYLPANSVSQSFTIAKGNQSITFALLEDKTFGDEDFIVTASASSGLPVGFTVGSSDECTIKGNNVHIEHSGSCSITASQEGDENYNPALSITRTILIHKKTVSINLEGLVHTVDGKPKEVMVVSGFPGLSIRITYIGTGSTIYGPSSQGPARVGTYSVTAEIEESDYQGSTTSVFLINPALTYLPTLYR